VNSNVAVLTFQTLFVDVDVLELAPQSVGAQRTDAL